ncbi:GNAT family N-acetyltransferase [Streptomyces pactum]|uniref:GNAT family N-acetyltransferase n=1 Tax=Streptomyces pactum TaxID=68249 RepID=UPI0036F7597D
MIPSTIARAVPADADDITALIRSSGAYRGPYAPMTAGYLVTPEYIARHQVFKAVDPDGRLLGFYSLLVEEAELDLAFVADEAQGTGIGRRLMEHMKERAARAGLSAVRVVSHPPSEDFYRRVGAERVGTVAPVLPKITWERPELRFTIA